MMKRAGARIPFSQREKVSPKATDEGLLRGRLFTNAAAPHQVGSADHPLPLGEDFAERPRSFVII
jgi:hypothetical protein